MKTDLTKTLAISGQSGLYTYLAQARNGAIVQSLIDGKKSCFPANSKMTALEDISIYTEDEEVKLKDVFLRMHEYLKDEDAPSAKSSADVLKGLFEQVLPEYDRDRFYVSHMKKVVEWYNFIKKYASFDFVNPQEENASETEVAGDEAEADKE